MPEENFEDVKTRACLLSKRLVVSSPMAIFHCVEV